MSLKSSLLLGSLLIMGLAGWVCSSWQTKDEAQIKRTSAEDWQLEFFHNSATMSQLLRINSAGAVIGFKEAPPDLKHVYFYYDSEGFKEMPMPKGFTVVEAAALSDNGLVVGRTMKAIGTAGSLRAVVWSIKSGELKLLPTPEGDAIADANDISADGKRITGYATGPQRLRPVIWQWNDAQSEWQVEVLPTAHDNNPYLMSSQLHITPDGNTIVGCCTENFLPNGTIDSSLYAWTKVDNRWTRTMPSAEQFYVKAINNKGQIVGSSMGEQGRLPCIVTLKAEFKVLELPEGKVLGEAYDINEQSQIVGWTDSAVGTDGGPEPCTWTLEGKITPLKITEFEVGMLYAINDQGQLAGAADLLIKPASSTDANEEVSVLLGVRISKAK